MRGSYHKSKLPHDLSHYVVEAELRLKRGFWGCIREGALFPSVTVVSGRQRSGAKARSQALIHAAHQERGASELLVGAFRAAARITDPALRFAELVSPELQQWFPAHVDKDTRRRIVERLRILESRWQDLSVGESITLFWPLGGSRTRQPSDRFSRLRRAR
ncbi:MAG TPA: hypothetical protein VKM54_18775 [Myxococcota bacterium]|nr:hypothetical protein [Myxococcota bacterium]